METKDLVSIVIAALAFMFSVMATTISLIRSKYEKQRIIRSQLSEILSQILSTNLENANLYQNVSQSDPMYFQTVSGILNQKAAFLLQQAMYLMNQIPGLVTEHEHNTVAVANANAGDLVMAEKHYSKAIEVSKTVYYRSLAMRSYAAHLFSQQKFEEGRKYFKKATTLLKGSDDYVRSANGSTYQMWGWYELNNANSEKRAQELFENAMNEFNEIDNKLVRDNAIKALEAAKQPKAPIETSLGISSQVVTSVRDSTKELHSKNTNSKGAT